MPVRATKRGEQRTPLERDCDVLICGASFAGLAIARELAGSGARVLMIDRYELGERQTSACAMPTGWMQALELMDSWRQSFDELVVHTPFRTARWSLPWSFSTFDYRELCALLWEQADCPELELETATVTGRDGTTVHTDRGELRAPLIVDALGWRRVLSNATADPAAATRDSRAAWRSTPRAAASRWSCGSTRATSAPATAGASPPATSCASASARSGPPTTSRSRPCGSPHDLELPPDGYQGNWIPHQLRRAVEDGVFFVGDSAGHCLPLTAEGIRTALYFGLACGRELRAVLDGGARASRRSPATAPSRTRTSANTAGC